jgi:hypothetical protein
LKNNRFLIFLVILLTVAVVYFIFTNKRYTIKKELRDFAIEDTGSIDKLFLADKSGHSATLTREGPSRWMVNGKYLARQDAINNLLFTLCKMTVRAPVAKAREENVLKEMAGINQRKIEIYSKGKLLKTIYVGAESADRQGTFMLLENSSVPFEVHIQGHRGFLQTRFITDDRLWRDAGIFVYDDRDIRSIKVTYTGSPQNSFTLNYSGNGFPTLTPTVPIQAQADTLTLRRYLSEYRRIGYEYVVTESFPQSSKDSILASKPWVEITVTDKTGKKNNVKGYHRGIPPDAEPQPGDPPFDTDRMYALLNDSDFVLVQFYQFDRILKPAGYFYRSPINKR